MKEPVAVANYHYLLHPYNTFLVTCCDAEGRANVITIAWLVPVSVQPPLVGMAIRPSRYSYTLIRAMGEFVINVAPYEIARQALYCGRRSGREVDKFAATGLTVRAARFVRPPVIEECLAHLECRVVQYLETGDHQFVIGEVVAAYARPGAAGDGGLYDLSQAQPLLHLGRDRFATTATGCVEPQLGP